MFDKIKKFFTEDIAKFIKKHSFITSCIVFCLVIGVVALVVFLNVNKDKPEKGTESTEVASSEEQVIEENRYALSTEADQSIVDVMTEYHRALAEDDEEVVKKYLLYVNENEMDNIAVKSQYINSYDDIKCYVQNGVEENSYYVYVSYMLSLTDFEEKIPGIIGFFYSPDENGTYHIFRKDDLSDEVYADFYVAFTEPDVQSLYKNVSLQYNEVLDSNEELKAYMDGFEEMVKEEMIERIAIREASEELEAASEAAASEQEAANEQGNNEENKEVIVEPTTTVNVRSSDSETADRLGKVSPGTKLTRLEEKINGWSKVLYDGKEGYIKSEYLKVVSETAGGTVTGTGTYVTVKENVNIRATASQSGERVALAVAGDKLELIEKMNDGWTKIKYNGKEAYVKSEYVE